jgi:predicted pyridoxine 5'-phosphate oxidase superfamily flavin-nucleotide-binding protein
MLIGRPGFMRSPDPKLLEIRTGMVDGDPLNGQLDPGTAVGLLGIEYETRRRNRLSARVGAADATGLSLHIEQTFGNCPQYIQARDLTLLDGIDTIGEWRDSNELTNFDAQAQKLIASSDNFYIASHHTDRSEALSNGADVSHRGGEPGFVKILDEQTLQFPDYPGNNHFNTFGNLLLSPRAGLTFIDFRSGDLLYLTGHAEIIWDGPEVDAIPGAKRLVRFTLAHGRRVAKAVPIRWNFLNYSPRLEQLKS